MVLPSGIVSHGWPSVRDTCAGFGVGFDPWQHGTGQAILAKRQDGTYAASVGGVVISIPRQVGKTYLIGAIVFALSMLSPGLTAIWTAHRARTAAETFASMQAFAMKVKVKPHVKDVLRGAGNESVVFHNKSRVLFGARERGFGRGFADVGLIVFDEAQILSENAIDDMVPAANTAANPLLIFTGTPPKPTDPSEVFTRKRREALGGDSDDTVYIEFSAEPDARPDDRKQWAKANPSFPLRTNESAMLRMKKMLSEESFLREGLGLWDEMDLTDQVIPGADWSTAAPEGCLRLGVGPLVGDVIVGPVVFGIDVAEDRSVSSFGAAGRSTAGALVHVEVIANEKGTAWVAPRAAGLKEKHGAQFAIAKGSPAASLLKELKKAGLKLSSPAKDTDDIVMVSTEDQAQMCGQFYDAAVQHRLRHRGQEVLDVAVRGAVKRDYNDSWLWSRRRSGVDISPLAACTWAAGLFGLNPPAVAVSAKPTAQPPSSGVYRPAGRLKI